MAAEQAPTTVYKRGEILDITLKGVRVTEDSDLNYCLRIELRQPAHLHAAPYPHVLPLRSPDMTIERVAPAEWPPLIGDLWTDRNGRPWFAVEVSDEDTPHTLELQGVSTYVYGRMAPADVNSAYGPMTLAHRCEYPIDDEEVS